MAGNASTPSLDIDDDFLEISLRRGVPEDGGSSRFPVKIPRRSMKLIWVEFFGFEPTEREYNLVGLSSSSEADRGHGGGAGDGPLATTVEALWELAVPRIAIQDPVDEARKAFRLFDREQKGFLTARDVLPHLEEAGLNTAMARAVFAEFDGDGDGRITLRDFFNAVVK
jgi:hypothetical protein